ncbi:MULTISPECIES: LysR family transcriptional regulator [unclassified Bradyrhizobium]|uniref:LysR family transcriptional regulator n=1 Tax=unclassified Bradyrhizobium TaxID=2631580 RepID=UPI0028F109CA|nr:MULTISPECIES: LysR family transcriptional regulator [unclassified Bradyrhizobium]
MVTLKQLEALNWIAELGTFERAAAKLNTTQSAISKRIQELEASARVPLFDRSQRGARLTERGEQILALGRQMLALQDQILELKDGRQSPARRLRLGATELSALTWLPRLVSAIREAHPAVMIEPEVETSRSLYDRLIEGSLDLVVIPDVFSDPEVTSLRLAEVQNVWTARPGLVRTRRSLDFDELGHHTILMQGRRSGSGLFVNKWLAANGVSFKRAISVDNLTALVGLAVAGLGISYLPQRCFRPLFEQKKLVILPVKPTLPAVPYAAMYRNDRPSAFAAAVADLARQTCDFGRQLEG